MLDSPQNKIKFKPILSLLNQTFAEFNGLNVDCIPKVTKLNAFLDSKNYNNKYLVFIEQNNEMPYPDLPYEQRIYKYGLIATRQHNWHDYFNALVWLKFPKTKSVLNYIHYQETQKQNSTQRSRKRDLLTLFDECGVIVQASEAILKLIRNHQWHELFVSQKQAWLSQEIKITTFGHALYEKYLKPYIGMTAKAILLPNNIDDLDNYLSLSIKKGEILTLKSELCPLPLLGIPDWHHTQNTAFYNNNLYFR